MKLKIFTILPSLLCGRKERGGGENEKQEQREKIKGQKKKRGEKRERNKAAPGPRRSPATLVTLGWPAWLREL